MAGNKTDMFGMPGPISIEASGTSFPLVAAGSGSSMLFIHGAWADLRIWCGLWERIAENHEFLAITQRHFGLDCWPDTKPFSSDVHTDDLLALLKSQRKAVHLVGWSYAGGILLRVAGKAPELVRSLTIYEPSLEIEAPTKDDSLRRARATFWKELEPAYSVAETGDLDAAMRLGIEIVFGLGEGGFTSLDSRFQRVFLDNVHTMIPDLEAPSPNMLTQAELQKITCPTLIVLGKRTHAQYQLIADCTHQILPNGSLTVFDGAGHGGPVQVPGRFAEAALEFVETVAVSTWSH